MAIPVDELVHNQIYTMVNTNTGFERFIRLTEPINPLSSIAIMAAYYQAPYGVLTELMWVGGFEEGNWAFFPVPPINPALPVPPALAELMDMGPPVVQEIPWEPWMPGMAAMAGIGAGIGAGAGAMGGAGGPGGALGGAAGAQDIFLDANQLLVGAKHILVPKPAAEVRNSILLEEFDIGDKIILIYEGGEHSPPHMFKRDNLLAYFNHALSQSAHKQLRNPATNSLIINRQQPLPVPNPDGTRTFNNGIIIKTGTIVPIAAIAPIAPIASRYPLRSKNKKSKRKQYRKMRQNTRRRKN